MEQKQTRRARYNILATEMQAAARRMGVADERAHEIAGAVLEVTATWRDHMTDAGVGVSDLALLDRCFAMREVVERWHDKRAGPQTVS